MGDGDYKEIKCEFDEMKYSVSIECLQERIGSISSPEASRASSNCQTSIEITFVQNSSPLKRRFLLVRELSIFLLLRALTEGTLLFWL